MHSPIKIEILNPFIAGAETTMKSMVFIKEIKRTALYLKNDFHFPGDVSATMGIGGGITGSVAFTMGEAAARHFVGNMLYMDGKDLTQEDLKDGAGELVNLVTGSAKTVVVGSPYAFNISVPSIIWGKNHAIWTRKDVPCIVVVMNADGHDFALQICVKEGED
jgi:CheY-specific phosphatase CheX